MMKRFALTAVGFGSAIALLLPQAGFAAQHAVSAQDNFFTPKNITVSQGDTVVWTNNGILRHTVTADDGSVDSSGTLRSGDTFTLRFNTAGTFPYFCRFHGALGGVGMAGTVTVTAAPSGAAFVSTSTMMNMMMNMPGMQQMMLQMMEQMQQMPSATSSQCIRITENLSVGKRDIRAQVRISPLGGDVAALQAFLRNQGFLPVNPTGFFGPLTLRAVQLFQSEHGIPATGFVGRLTRARIEAITCGTEDGTTGTATSTSTTTP